MNPGCRFCATPLERVFVDLGMSPLANSYLESEQLRHMEPFYPLRPLVCERCYLVQLEEFASPEAIFSDYAYFSSYSTSWLEHSRTFAASAVERFALGPSSKVVELASNDGYLLQYFAELGAQVLGVEPAENVARMANENGIPTVIRFFGRATALELATEHVADFIVANNVLAHVPNLNDFVAGMAILLAPDAVISLELPHLQRLVEDLRFDTIYHEHFSYFSLLTARQVFGAHGLRVFDTEQLATHGGSLRVFACHDASDRTTDPSVEAIIERERAAGLDDLDAFADFGGRVEELRHALLSFLIDRRRAGEKVVGYGAPAKGNTLLNYCGVRPDLLPFTVDMSPHKQGLFLPGTHIPIRPPAVIREERPDYVLILPWNLRDEIIEQMAHVREWGGRFVVPSPRVQIVE